MKKDSKTITISLFAGPGTGKSILASELFSFLKRKRVNCELSLEYIKNKLYEESNKTAQNQIYLFGKQQHQLFRLLNKVDIIITDSPLPFFTIYDPTNCQEFKNLVLKEFNSYNNINIFITRDLNIPYETAGRYQKDVDEALKVDYKIKNFLDDENIEYNSIIGIDGHLEYIYDLIKNYGKNL